MAVCTRFCQNTQIESFKVPITLFYPHVDSTVKRNSSHKSIRERTKFFLSRFKIHDVGTKQLTRIN